MTKDIVFGHGNEWVGYTFGAIFIVLGILVLFKMPKSRAKVEKYKKEQLEVYKKNNPRSRATNYKQTNLYIPWGVRMKSQIPGILGVGLIIIGVSWIVGNTLFST